ncbi:hypothetical protein BDZ89DRAFT_467483 [Hymenopellis radicata]|nr:hypothetical protein BDZ89DRAFT_467483 [Hymenopellis radicata]
MEELAPTLIASEYARHLIRHVELTCLEGSHERPSPDPLYDWLPLLPSDTVISLDIYTHRDNDIPVDAARFMDTLLRSPMLNSIRHLSMTNGEAFFEGVNHMAQLLMSAPNVSHLSIDFPSLPEISRPSLDIMRLLPPSHVGSDTSLYGCGDTRLFSAICSRSPTAPLRLSFATQEMHTVLRTSSDALEKSRSRRRFKPCFSMLIIQKANSPCYCFSPDHGRSFASWF